MGAFCEIYGDTIKNKVIEYILENQDIDFAISDMAREIGISKPKAYEVINEYEKKDYVKKSRIIGKTQLYKINRTNRIMKFFMKNFLECLKLVDYTPTLKRTSIAASS